MPRCNVQGVAMRSTLQRVERRYSAPLAPCAWSGKGTTIVGPMSGIESGRNSGSISDAPMFGNDGVNTCVNTCVGPKCGSDGVSTFVNNADG